MNEKHPATKKEVLQTIPDSGTRLIVKSALSIHGVRLRARDKINSVASSEYYQPSDWERSLESATHARKVLSSLGVECPAGLQEIIDGQGQTGEHPVIDIPLNT